MMLYLLEITRLVQDTSLPPDLPQKHIYNTYVHVQLANYETNTIE